MESKLASNLQSINFWDTGINGILQKSVDPREKVTDDEFVRIASWITKPEYEGIYVAGNRLPPQGQGLFRIQMEESEFWSGWDGGDQWDYNATTMTTSVHGDKTLKKFQDVERRYRGYYRTIYQISGPQGTPIVLVHYQVRVDSDDEETTYESE